ncbi:putative nucleoside-diphosphate-sugar epimerase protein [Lasiodiplodia theobromae]|nr:putative nucleoside-diphosphate-sugar epimerase protein [Lasiodiplodia theobromae]
MPAKVALVTGCNGISGHAIAEHLTKQPDTEWTKIIVSSRSTPKSFWIDPRVHFVAVDFLKPKDDAIKALKPLCGDVTHVFFASYVHNNDLSKLAETNVPLFVNFMDAIDEVCPKLERVCLQTGGKHYGVHLGPLKQPVTEDIGRYDDKNGTNFYYPQEDYMREVQKRRNQWAYNIIRPFGIIGFTPHATGMAMGLLFAVYILVNKELGIEAPFPGPSSRLDLVDDISYAPAIADMTLWAATNEHTKNEDFNNASGDTVVYRYFWPELASYFGLQISNVTALETSMAEWAKDKRPVWEQVVKKYGGNVEVFDWCEWESMNWLEEIHWPILPSATKARKFGWKRFDTATECWFGTFKSFQNAGILPRVPTNSP